MLRSLWASQALYKYKEESLNSKIHFGKLASVLYCWGLHAVTVLNMELLGMKSKASAEVPSTCLLSNGQQGAECVLTNDRMILHRTSFIKTGFCSFVKLSEQKKSFESHFRSNCIFCSLWVSSHLFIAGFENNRHKRIRIPPWLKGMSFYLALERIICFHHFLEHSYTKPCADWLLMRPCTFASLSLSLVLFYCILLMILLLCVDCNAWHWFYWNSVLILFSKKRNY